MAFHAGSSNIFPATERIFLPFRRCKNDQSNMSTRPMKRLLLASGLLLSVLGIHAQSSAADVLAPGRGFATGFTHLNELLSAGAFPNPTNGPFFLEYDLDNESEVFVEVFDLLGRMVYSETSTRTPGHQLHAVNLGDQANGVYFIRCTIKAPSGTTTTLTSKVTLSR
jgi:hypothetical protein